MTSDFIYSVDRLKDYRRLENTFDLNKLEDNDELLSGENFIKIADSIYSNDNTIWKFDHRRLENTFDLNNLKDINIVYFHTMYKDYFFDLVKSLKNKFIVITHNTDLEVNNLYNLPRNVIKWYSTNVNIIDERVEPIPIGLENNNWFPHLKKQEKIFEKIKTIKCCKNLVYMNHNIGTNIEERRIPFDLLKEEDFVTTQMGANGKYFDSYLDNVYNHKFVICPEGNGRSEERRVGQHCRSGWSPDD